jgi:PAS domain S-box-containing protein
MDKSSLRTLFIRSCIINVQKIDNALVALRKNSKDKAGIQLIRDAAHQLEGDALLAQELELAYFISKIDSAVKLPNIDMALLRDLRDSLRGAIENVRSLGAKRKSLLTQRLKNTLTKLSRVEVERKQAEDKLVASESKMSTILKTMPYGIDIVDENLNLVWMSDKLLKLFGKQALDKKCYKIYKDNNKQCIDCPLKKPIRVGETCSIITSDVAGGRIFKITHTGMMLDGKKVSLEFFEDITDRQKSEEKIRLSDEIIKNMSEGVYLIRVADSKILYTNPKFAKMFGYSPTEMVGKHVSIVNSPRAKNPKQTVKDISRDLLRQGWWVGEVLNMKKNGQDFWCHANVSVFNHSEYGKIMVAVHTDITKQKESQNKLVESEDLYRTITETAMDGIVQLDPKGNIIFSNSAAAKIFGYTQAGMLRLNLMSLLPKQNVSKGQILFRNVLRGKSENGKFIVRRKNGREMIITYSIVPLRKKGNIVGVTGIIRDT